MKKISMVIIGVASVASLALTGCSSSSTADIEGFKAGFVEGFMKASQNSGLTDQERNEIAECGWRGVQKTLTKSDLMELQDDPNSAQSKEIQKKVEAIGSACNANKNAY